MTVADIRLAHREGYSNVEHMKRYTTHGMGTDQGKTGGLVGSASSQRCGARRRDGRAADGTALCVARELGAFWPAPRSALISGPSAAFPCTAGTRRMAPSSRSSGSGCARSPIRRPAMRAGARCSRRRGRCVAASASATSRRSARSTCRGATRRPSSTASTPTPFDAAGGRARYGLMLREDGIVFDDGTVARLGETHFVSRRPRPMPPPSWSTWNSTMRRAGPSSTSR